MGRIYSGTGCTPRHCALGLTVYQEKLYWDVLDTKADHTLDELHTRMGCTLGWAEYPLVCQESWTVIMYAAS